MPNLLSESKTMFPLRRFDGKTENLTGRYKGRLEVFGLSRELQGAWVCECACGTFCLRRAKAINNPENIMDSCQGCRK